MTKKQNGGALMGAPTTFQDVLERIRELIKTVEEQNDKLSKMRRRTATAMKRQRELLKRALEDFKLYDPDCETCLFASSDCDEPPCDDCKKNGDSNSDESQWVWRGLTRFFKINNKGGLEDMSATQSQIDYIEMLLLELDADLSDYSPKDYDEMTPGDASQLIQYLRDELAMKKKDKL